MEDLPLNIFANNHKLLKIDELTNLSISTSTVDKIFKILKDKSKFVFRF